MSAELAKKAREANKSKASRMAAGDPHAKVDASSWQPPEALNADVQTGERPVSRRQYKRGGKVEGELSAIRADRKPRKSGGMTANEMINRNVKSANDEREGVKHVGGFASGGDVGETKRPAMPSYEHAYNRESVDKAIDAAYRGRKPQSAKGRAVTHALLRGPYATGGNVGDTVPTSRLAFSGGESRLAKAAGLKKGGRAKKAMGGDLAILSPALMAANAIRDKDKGAKDISPILNLKKGGAAGDGKIEGTRPTGGRIARKEGGGNWIAAATKHKGALHRELHVPEGEKIPAKKLAKAEHSKNPTERKRAELAETLKGMNRSERASGGRTKGKTNINIIIGQPGGGNNAMPMPPPNEPVPPPPVMAPKPVMAGPPPGMPPQGLAAGPPVGAPPPMPPMGRKRGGRTYGAGAGSGEGRLEKIREYGKNA